MDWELRLNDAISSPAKRMAAAINTVESSFRRLDAATRLRGIDRATSALNRQQDALRRLNLTRSRAAEQPARMRERASSRATADGGGGGGMLESISTAAAASPLGKVAAGYLAVATAALAATVAAARFTEAFTRSVLSAVDFRRGTLAALTVMQKSASEAAKTYEVGIKLSAKFHTDPEETIRSLQEIVSKGFSTGQAKIIMTALADLKVVSPTANMEGLAKAIGDIKGKGRLELEELKEQLGENGLPVSAVLDQLAKRMGKSVDDVRKAMSAGKISSDEGIWAIIAAIKAMGTGRLGELAENAAHKSLGGLVNGIKTNLALARLELAKGLDDSAGVSAAMAALNNIVNALNPDKSPAMKRLISASTRFADALFTALFGPLSDKETGQGLQDILNRVAGAIERITPILAAAAPLVAAFLGGMGEGFQAAYDVVADVVSRIAEAMGGDGAAAMADFGSVARIAGKAAAYLAIGVGAVAAVVVAVAAALVALTAGGTAALASFFAPILPAAAAAVAELGLFWAAFQAIPGKIKGAAGGMAEAVGGLLSAGWEKLKAKASEAMLSVRAEVASLLVIFASLPLVTALQSLAGGLLAAGGELGRNLWRGFVDGITEGITAVLDAGTRLANAARSAVGDALLVQSPSRVMMEMGGYTAEGFAQGVDDGSDQVDASMRDMVAPPAPRDFAAAGASGAAGGSPSFSVSVGPIYIAGTTDEKAGDDLGQRIAEKVRDMLEDMLAQGGLAPTLAPLRSRYRRRFTRSPVVADKVRSIKRGYFSPGRGPR
jgi:tape measure domain-containing protein